MTDDAAGVRSAVNHLVDCGYRRIGYVEGEAGSSNLIRQAAVAATLRSRGVRTAPRIFPASDDAWRAPGALAEAIAADPPEALVCYDDKLALALMDALRLLGIRVPDDIGDGRLRRDPVHGDLEPPPDDRLARRRARWAGWPPHRSSGRSRRDPRPRAGCSRPSSSCGRAPEPDPDRRGGGPRDRSGQRGVVVRRARSVSRAASKNATIRARSPGSATAASSATQVRAPRMICSTTSRIVRGGTSGRPSTST